MNKNEPASSTQTLASALRILANDIESADGVANVCLHEAAGRLDELDQEVQRLARLAEARGFSGPN